MLFGTGQSSAFALVGFVDSQCLYEKILTNRRDNPDRGLKISCLSVKTNMFLPPFPTCLGSPFLKSMEQTMSDVTVWGGLTVATELFDLVNNEILVDTGISPDQFWSAFDTAAHKLAPKNHALLQTRASLQAQIDDYLKKNAASGIDAAAYESFLRDIGYLVDDAGDFTIDTANVDPEIATIAGPQLVVPITNARYALNAANARWGSLYDALYGSDAIAVDSGAEKTSGGYNPVRGAKVIAFARAFLDESAPLAGASWTDISGLAVENGTLQVTTSAGQTGLVDARQFVGYTGDATIPASVILIRHGLHLEILIKANGTVGARDAAHIDDIWSNRR